MLERARSVGVTATVASLQGLDAAAIEEQLAGLDQAAIVDELMSSTLARVSGAPFPAERFAVRVVFEERTAVHVRVLERAAGAWRAHADPGTAAGDGPDLIARWQGLAPAIRCENGDQHLQSAVITGVCRLEGELAAQEMFTSALAHGSDDPTAMALGLRGLSDSRLRRRLRTFDVGGLVRGMVEISAEVWRHFGSPSEFGKRTVVELVVPHGGRTYVWQGVADGSTTTVRAERAEPAQVSCVLADVVDFVRLCTGETTPSDLVVSGKVAVEGELSMLANVDLLRSW